MTEPTLNTDLSQSRAKPLPSLGHSLQRASTLVRKNVWTWPIIAGLVLAVVGWFLRGAVDRSLKDDLRSKLETIRNAEAEAIELWVEARGEAVHSLAEDPEFRELAEQQIELGSDPDVSSADLLVSAPYEDLLELAADHVARHHFDGFLVLARNGRVVAAQRPASVGLFPDPDATAELIERLDRGRPLVTKPFRSVITLEDSHGEERAGVPTMFAAMAIQIDDEELPDVEEDGFEPGTSEPIGYLLLRIRPWVKFTEILQIARVGRTGETYAFDRDGLMLSQSRFDDEMRQQGILGSTEDSILVIQARDPGGDMTRGHRPTTPVDERPLTEAVASAVAGETGVEMTPYRDYRGVKVVGAWQWMDSVDFGIVTEIDADEAFGPLKVVRTVFWTMFALLAAASVVIFVNTLRVARANLEARRAALDARQLGQYELDRELGRGGMGVVYLGRHAMLQRPAAVKFLDAEKTNERSIARFEREVQQTSRLTHPNTIAIYDYGRSPEGVFYYAMEYLEGVELSDLVHRFGPLPDERVAHILVQIAGSLAEAHDIGLVHRDIKPANVMLTFRGGIADFVKVLDFGLVKVVDDANEPTLTQAGMITGTPLYMAPESIREREHVDGRSDLYALGALGYCLLTGGPPFEKGTALEILRQHLDAEPQPPSARLGRTVDRDLESILLSCLAKSPKDRPATARDLLHQLEQCECVGKWTQRDALTWWRENGTAFSIDLDKTFDEVASSTVGDSPLQREETQTDVSARTS